jgi:hypothetical protein
LTRNNKAVTPTGRRKSVSENELVKQLKQWRETRTRKVPQQSTSDRRMVRVNGQEVVVITKARGKAQG